MKALRDLSRAGVVSFGFYDDDWTVQARKYMFEMFNNYMLTNLPIRFDENPSMNKQIITIVHKPFWHTSYNIPMQYLKCLLFDNVIKYRFTLLHFCHICAENTILQQAYMSSQNSLYGTIFLPPNIVPPPWSTENFMLWCE